MINVQESATAACRPSSTTVELLLVEDDDGDAKIVQRALRGAGASATVRVTRCQRLCDSTARVADTKFDVVLLDLGLPDGVGLGNLDQILAHANLPVVILTGQTDEALAMQAVQRGAQDYLVKGHFDHRALDRAIRYAIDRHRLLTQVQESAARESELKDRFLSHVSHELRTPLTAIHQFVGIVRDKIAGELTAKQAEYLAIVSRNVEQLRRMIADLMEVTRLGSGKLPLDMGLVDVADHAAEAIESLTSLAADKAIEVSASLPRGLPRVLGDGGRITQVLVNLVGNAIKYTQAEGRVTVSVAHDPRCDSLRMTVEDNGRGIPPEALEQIFERLYQVDPTNDTSRHGLGLGLHISHEIVTLLGGELTVESEVGKGSRFHVNLPVYRLANVVERVVGTVPTGTGLVLITVRVGNSGSQSARQRDAALREIALTLQSCVLAATDAVLPERVRDGNGELLFALARASGPGGAAIADRVREHLARRGRVATLGCSTAVTWQQIEFAPGKDRKETIERATHTLRAKMQEGEEQP